VADTEPEADGPALSAGAAVGTVARSEVSVAERAAGGGPVAMDGSCVSGDEAAAWKEGGGVDGGETVAIASGAGEAVSALGWPRTSGKKCMAGQNLYLAWAIPRS